MTVEKEAHILDEELFVDKFIGREDLLDIVDEAISDVPNNHVITFLGEGGIGKTALLRRIYRKYENRNDIIVIHLDYAQAGMTSSLSVLRHVMKQFLAAEFIAPDDTAVLESKSSIAQNAFEEGKEEEEFEKIQLDAIHGMIDRFNDVHAISRKRLVAVGDSYETMVFNDVVEEIAQWSSAIKNSVLIYAGRPNDACKKSFEDIFPRTYGSAGWKVHKPIEIGLFDVANTTSYFAKVLPAPLEPELVETITMLTSGKPVLLALTAEWFKQNVELPKDINMTKADLETLNPIELRQKKKEFEQALVERVRAMQEPFSHALLYMSFLDRRYDKRILQLALDNLPVEEIEALEPKLKRMAFIRSFLEEESGLLHDEAKRLINEYVWPPYDPEYEERRALSRKVIDKFYLPEIEKLNAVITNATKLTVVTESRAYHSPEEYLLHRYEMECLDYHFRISLDEGRRYVTQLIRKRVTLPLREDMRREITARAGSVEAMVAVARMNLARGKFDQSREIIAQELECDDLSPWYRTMLLYELSDVPIDPHDKAVYLREALNIAEESQDKLAMARINNDLGLMYRRQGLWKEAEDAYQQTLEILKSVDDPNQRAATLNNLSFVKMLQGELDLAESLADIALGIRKEQANQAGIAFSHLTKGEIAEAKGNREQATLAYQTAAALFKELGRDQNYAEALIHLSEIKRIDREFEVAEEFLTFGLQQPSSEIRAKAERELGALNRTQGLQSENTKEKADKYKVAVGAFQKSLETSKQKRDLYGQAQALYDLVFMSYLMEDRINDDYADQLREILDKHDYRILKVQLDEIYADVAFDQGEIISAFQTYVEIARVLSSHHIRKYTAMLERFKSRFLSQPVEFQQEMCTYFDQVIAGLPPESRLRSSLDSLCQAISIAY